MPNIYYSNDVRFEITSILFDLAVGYNGDAKTGIAALISRIEIDLAIPEIHRAPF